MKKRVTTRRRRSQVVDDAEVRQVGKNIDDVMVGLYLKGVGIVELLNYLKERGISLSVCLFPHANIDVLPQDTTQVVRLLESILPAVTDDYFNVLRQVREEILRLWSEVVGDEYLPFVMKLLDSLVWASKVYTQLLVKCLSSTDVLIEKVMEDGGFKKYLAFPLPAPNINADIDEARKGETNID